MRNTAPVITIPGAAPYEVRADRGPEVSRSAATIRAPGPGQDPDAGSPSRPEAGWAERTRGSPPRSGSASPRRRPSRICEPYALMRIHTSTTVNNPVSLWRQAGRGRRQAADRQRDTAVGGTRRQVSAACSAWRRRRSRELASPPLTASESPPHRRPLDHHRCQPRQHHVQLPRKRSGQPGRAAGLGHDSVVFSVPVRRPASRTIFGHRASWPPTTPTWAALLAPCADGRDRHRGRIIAQQHDR